MSNDMQRQALRLKGLISSGELIDRKTLAKERELLATKWFDYRFISPARATRLFIRAYQESFRRKIYQEVDVELARHANGINTMTFERRPGVRTQVWKARQRADEVGMPYELYIETAFDFALRRKRKRMPQPNQLHFPGGAQASWESICNKVWEDRVRDGLFKVTHPAYLIENYQGLPAQDEYRQFIRQQALVFHKPLRHLIRHFTFNLAQVPPEIFEGIVSPEVFETEVTLARDEAALFQYDPEPTQPFEKHDLWSSCFGLPHARDASASSCSSCPQSAGCKIVGDAVLRKLEERCGSSTPKDDHKKAMARQRKQKQRALARERAQAAVEPEKDQNVTLEHPGSGLFGQPDMTSAAPEVSVTLSNSR